MLCPQTNCLSLHFCKNITCLSVRLLSISQVLSVSCQIVCQWVMTNCCFMSYRVILPLTTLNLQMPILYHPIHAWLHMYILLFMFLFLACPKNHYTQSVFLLHITLISTRNLTICMPHSYILILWTCPVYQHLLKHRCIGYSASAQPCQL